MSSPNPPSDLRRHALVWLKQVPQPELQQDAPEVERWHARDLPFVACRHRGKSGHVSLGFCVSSADSPARRPRWISVQGRNDLVLRIERPPLLAVVAESGSTGALANALSGLSARASGEGLKIHVFGSWMWQAITREIHVNASSDLDVLIDVANQAEAEQAASFLQLQETACPINIDGELSFPGQGEVHWREYLSDVPQVLFKSITTVRLMPKEDLWK